MRSIRRLEEDTEEDTCVDFHLSIAANGSARYSTIVKTINAALLRNMNKHVKPVRSFEEFKATVNTLLDGTIPQSFTCRRNSRALRKACPTLLPKNSNDPCQGWISKYHR